MVVNAADSPRELHVESLLGRVLHDVDGRKIGRIEELVAEQRGTEWIVVELHVGTGRAARARSSSCRRSYP